LAETDDPRFADYIGEAKYALSFEADALAHISTSLLMAERSAQALARVLVALETEALQEPAIVKAMEDTELNPKSYAYIAHDLREFLRVMFELDKVLEADLDYAHGQFRYRPVRFMEVGCGPGRNLYVIRNGGLLLWSTVEGIDVVGPYIDAARAAFRLGDAVWQDDARVMDYSPYDVIFSHRPFMDAEAEAEYEDRLVSQMKPGAYLLAPLSETHHKDTRLVAIGETEVIWKRL